MEFKDITIKDFMTPIGVMYKEERELLIKSGIYDMQQLIEAISSDKRFDKTIFRKWQNQAISLVLKAQDKDFKENIYHEEITEDKGLLKVINNDSKTTWGNVLVIFSLSSSDYLKTILGRYKIEEIKYLISHYNLRGKNALVASLEGMGQGKIGKMLRALDFYNEQIKRLHEENRDHEGFDLFLLNKEEKLKIVREEMEQITCYLFNMTSNFIWGRMSENEKLQIETALKRGNLYKDKRLVNLGEIISNYVTLRELEQGITRNRTLDRFKKE